MTTQTNKEIVKRTTGKTDFDLRQEAAATLKSIERIMREGA